MYFISSSHVSVSAVTVLSNTAPRIRQPRGRNLEDHAPPSVLKNLKLLNGTDGGFPAAHVPVTGGFRRSPQQAHPSVCAFGAPSGDVDDGFGAVIPAPRHMMALQVHAADPSVDAVEGDLVGLAGQHPRPGVGQAHACR